MRLKRTIIVIISLFLICCFTSCKKGHLHPLIVLNEKFEIYENVYLIVRNNLEEERFEIQYISRRKDKKLGSRVSFSMRARTNEFSWTSEKINPNQPSVIKISSSNDNIKLYESDSNSNSYYIVLGETTVYISYKDLDDQIKEYCKEFNPSTTYNPTLRITVFGYGLLNRY